MDYKIFLYLCYCAVNNIRVDKDRVKNIALKELFCFSKLHSLTALICYALESAGVKNKLFIEEKEKSIRKNLMLDSERLEIFKFLEQKGIWYMPLKGVYLKNLYPKAGMRQMSDNDIFYNKEFKSDVIKFFVDRGYMYKCKKTVDNHDVFIKPPLYNFEMHTSLFGEMHKKLWRDYFKNIKEKLILEDGMLLSFTNEDFYIYMTVHECKHFYRGGTGIRSLIDCYVYLKRYEEILDWDYIYKELQKLGIDAFEESRRILCKKIFSNSNLSDKELELLKYYMGSGTYGNTENKVKNDLNEIKNSSDYVTSVTKIKYVINRAFPTGVFWKSFSPFFYKHKYLLPIGWIYRLIYSLLFKTKKVFYILKTIKRV